MPTILKDLDKSLNYETGTFAATGALTGTLRYTLVGKQVTIWWPSLAHSSSATPASAADCIPAHLRPDTFTNNIYIASTVVVRRLEIDSAGTMGFQYLDWGGSPSAQTGTGQGSITYIIP